MPDKSERLRAVAERIFPRGARLIAPPGDGEYVLLASWKLGTDPKRPNKRSKTVRVAVSEEAIADYARGANGQRDYSDARFEAILRSKLAGLDPSHDAPPGSEPPIEKWTINTIELNG
jgi:hypothetical protein